MTLRSHLVDCLVCIAAALAGSACSAAGATTATGVPAAARSPAAPSAGDSILAIEASRVIGTIKPLQDLGLGPLLQRGEIDLTPYYEDLRVRTVRLHDVPWVYENVQDMNYVFPKDTADAGSAENYDFALTDHYVESISSAGIDVIYRLGYSAAFFAPRALQYIDPPRSYEHWADVAAHIVAHYDQGWDGGPSAHIKYWEIWNEPDTSIFWTGQPEDYFRLYEMTAKRIKSADATLKVGGPALAGGLPFLESFLKYCRDHQAPVDFVSWHIYTTKPEAVVERGKRVHDLMVRYGFGKAQSILDEWNYGFGGLWDPSRPGQAEGVHAYYELTRGEVGAAFDAAVLMAIQDASVDMAHFYTGSNMSTGLFTYEGAPTKAYYAFLAFANLLDCPQRLALTGAAGTRVTALAGLSKDGSAVRVLIAYRGDGPYRLDLRLDHAPWKGDTVAQLQLIDRASRVALPKPVTPVAKGGLIHLEMDGPTVELLTFRAPGP
jgi:xylan 1,4-beta-xylosidase